MKRETVIVPPGLPGRYAFPRLTSSSIFLAVILTLMSGTEAIINLDLPIPAVEVVNEGILHGGTICPNIGASGQGAGAQYFFALTAVLPDPGLTSPFELVQGIPSDTNTAEVRAVVPPGLNYEVESRYELTITVVDLNDAPAGTVSGTLTVDVTDDPERPYFTNLPSQCSIGESVTVPDTFKLVTAMDDDSPPTEISFSIAGTNPFGAPFQIGNVIYSPGDAVAEIQNAPYPGFDYETQFNDLYELYIAVSDGTLAMTSTLTVSIFDENEPVRITNLPDTTSVSENIVGNFFQVEWDDEDIFDAGTPTFSISTVPSNGPFSVDVSGNIQMVTPGLDYLSNNHWTVNVYIEDPDGLTDSGQLQVQVIDVNMGPEIINMPAGITVQVGEFSSAGSDIFNVEAFDEDADEYFCALFTNPSDGNFAINSSSNVIYVVDEPTLDFETTSSYTLTVTCHDNVDSGLPRDLTVEVVNENENPEIRNLPATVTVPEDAVNMSPIFVADGYDVDGDKLNYVIAVSPAHGLAKFFVANTASNDAQISIVDNPGFDFESTTQYTVTLSASDGALTATGTLNVDIVDIEEPPRFLNNNQEVMLDEEQATGTLVSVDWSVIDVDDPLNSLVYDMIGGTYTPYFRFIGGSNPKLKIARTMDYEDNFPVPFNVLFSVTDPAGGRDYLSLDVYLLDINDNSPVFSQSQYIGSVYEMETYGFSVLHVSASDDDVADTVTYDISPTSPFFAADPQSGDVTVKQAIDRETVGDVIHFTMIASDNRSPPSTRTANVQVIVVDINDNAPKFQKDFWNWEIRYDATAGSYVKSVTATDADSSINGAITYKMYLVNLDFAIDKDGKVYTERDLRPSHQYTLVCNAHDNGNPVQVSHVTMIRIDTYIPWFVLVDVYIGTNLNDLTSTRRQELIEALNSIYQPWFFRISSVRSMSDQNPPTRRLLQEVVIVEMYALTNNNTEYQSNVTAAKEFVYYSDLVSAMTIHSDGTPSDILSVPAFDDFPVIRVEPTYGKDDINWWLDTKEGIATICVIILLSLLVFSYLVYLCFRKRQSWQRLLKRCCHQCDCKKTTGRLRSLCKKQEKVENKKDIPQVTLPVAWEGKAVKRPMTIPSDTLPPTNEGTFELRYGNRPHYTMLGSATYLNNQSKDNAPDLQPPNQERLSSGSTMSDPRTRSAARSWLQSDQSINRGLSSRGNSETWSASDATVKLNQMHGPYRLSSPDRLGVPVRQVGINTPEDDTKSSSGHQPLHAKERQSRSHSGYSARQRIDESPTAVEARSPNTVAYGIETSNAAGNDRVNGSGYRMRSWRKQ
ncbi:cadherin EGF LAG seven-pass G-type receptor 2-like [Ptychodera flava]|uniref:cadherin EGF LAG seven-pass G-type receptor 2-like n=1 Tax=Ptychodera flava TaxID=63121 RepID=UPI00396AA814